MEAINELLQMVSENLAGLIKSDVAEGAPISLGKVTLVPLSKIRIGFGGGHGDAEGEGEHPHHGFKGKNGKAIGYGEGRGIGVGGGGRIKPVAVAVFTEGGVDILTVPVPERKHTLEKIFEKVPDLIDRLRK